MINKKKGVVFEFTLAFAAVVIFLFVFIILLPKTKISDLKIGDVQAAQLKTYIEAEKVLFYVNQAAILAADQAAYDMAKEGIEQSDCGEYKEYPIWRSEDKECFPDSSKLAALFLQPFKGRFFEIIGNHPIYNIPEDFEFSLNPNNGKMNILGLASSELTIPIINKELKEKSTDVLEDFGEITEEEKIPGKTTEKITKIYHECPEIDLVDIPPDIRCTAKFCKVHKELLPKLIELKETIAKSNPNYQLVVTSAFRTLEYQAYLNSRNRGGTASASCTSPHVTGKTIDIKIDGWDLGNIGVFEDVSWAYNEQKNKFSRSQFENQKQLRELMAGLGFVGYQNQEQTVGEWWHFECCNTVRYARAKNQGVDVIV